MADGTTNDAPAINKAINATNKSGGGTVFVPSGIYACGSIHLKSNISLVLDAGAVLKAIALKLCKNIEIRNLNIREGMVDRVLGSVKAQDF